MNASSISILVSVLISLVSFIGALTFVLNEKVLNKIVTLLIGFAAGTLIGGAFLHLIPEALEGYSSTEVIFLLFLGGFVFFFLMERFMHWRHCHKTIDCDIHPFGALNLFGGAIHNITDGMVIAGTFFINFQTGIAAAFAIIAHKIPHEMGDIAVLLRSNYSKKRAVLYNYISDLFIVVGTVIGLLLVEQIENMGIILSAVSAGGFVYVAASDLIPMIHQNKNQKESNIAFLFFVLGLAFMWLNKRFMA